MKWFVVWVQRLSPIISALLLTGCLSGFGIVDGTEAGESAVSKAAEKLASEKSPLEQLKIDRRESAKPANCPAMIRPGKWTAVPLKSGEIFSFAETVGLGAVIPAPQQNSQVLEIERTCKPSFEIDFGDHQVEMHPAGTDKQSLANIFVGQHEADGIKGHYVFRSTAEDQGLLDLVAGGRAKAGFGNWTFKYRLESNGYTGKRVECYCRSLLEKEIQKLISHAQNWASNFGNKSLRKKPADWEKEWNIKTYVNSLIAKFQPSALKKAKGSLLDVAAGSVDDRCRVHVGNDHLRYCNSALKKESTIVHETVHQAQCQAIDVTNNSPQVVANVKVGRHRSYIDPDYGDIDQYADDEVKAYQVQIKFLSSWIQNNCDS